MDDIEGAAEGQVSDGSDAENACRAPDDGGATFDNLSQLSAYDSSSCDEESPSDIDQSLGGGGLVCTLRRSNTTRTNTCLDIRHSKTEGSTGMFDIPFRILFTPP